MLFLVGCTDHMTYVDGTLVKFRIWDTTGNGRFDILTASSCRHCQASIVVYDITNVGSFSWAKQWIQELQSKISPGIFIALVGNKNDLANSRKVEYEVR